MRRVVQLVYFTTTKRKLIEPQAATVESLEEMFKISSTNYEFVITKKPPFPLIYTHRSDTPAAVLKKPAIHILPDSVPELNKREKLAAVTKQLQQNYQESFKKCKSALEIFHLQRRIKYQIRKKLFFVGYLSGKYKHLLMFKPLFEMMGDKTQEQYEKKGVNVQLIDATIYPMGKVWLPTSQRYLKHFENIIRSISQQKAYQVLDIGCGSGILSFLFAKKSKKSRIIAVDSNPDAVKTTNINAAKLNFSNIQALQFNVKDQAKFEIMTMEYKIQKQFDFIFINPPWIAASKLEGDSVIGDGVYDKDSKMLINSLTLAKRLLSKEGKIIVIYSDLSNIIGLTSKTIESMANELGLSVQLKEQQQLNEQLSKKSALQEFKNKAKILTYVLSNNDRTTYP